MKIDERRHYYLFHCDSEQKYSSLPIVARKPTASDILNAIKSSSSTSQLTKQIMAPVWELIFGCQILVMNFILGGSKGYSLGISI
jgi:hypothetical protein